MQPNLHEAPEDTKKLEDSERVGRNVAWYSNRLNAWFNSRLAIDRTIILLSAVWVWLLIALAAMTDAFQGSWDRSMAAFALGDFVVAGSAAFFGMWQGPAVIEETMRNDGQNKRDRLSAYAEVIARWCFAAGWLIGSLLGLSMILNG